MLHKGVLFVRIELGCHIIGIWNPVMLLKEVMSETNNKKQEFENCNTVDWLNEVIAQLTDKEFFLEFVRLPPVTRSA